MCFVYRFVLLLVGSLQHDPSEETMRTPCPLISPSIPVFSSLFTCCPISPILAPSLAYFVFCVHLSLLLHTGHVTWFCAVQNTAAVHSGSLRTVTETVRKPLTTDHAPALQSQPVCFGNGGWNNSQLQQVLIKKTQMWDPGTVYANRSGTNN